MSSNELEKSSESSKLFPALKEAWKEAGKEKKISSRVLVFLRTFWKEWREVADEKTATSEEANAGVRKKFDEVLGDMNEAMALDESAVEGDDMEVFERVNAMAVRSLKELSNNSEVRARDGIRIFNDATRGKIKVLSFKQASALAAVGLSTLIKLKNDCDNDKDKFKKALRTYSKVSEFSQYPLNKILSSRVMGIFKITDQNEGLKFLNKFGIRENFDDLKGKGPATKAKKLLEGLAEEPIQNEGELIPFLKKHFFLNTSEKNIKKAVLYISKLVGEDEDAELDLDVLSELLFVIHDDDLKYIFEKLK